MASASSLEPAVRDARSAEFFDALGRGALLLRRCTPHGHLSAPEVLLCASCGSGALDWSVAAGTGHLVSWTAVHSRPGPSGPAGPVVLAGIVELDEGPWLRARLLTGDSTAIRTGARVQLRIHRGAGEPVPAFELSEAGAAPAEARPPVAKPGDL